MAKFAGQEKKEGAARAGAGARGASKAVKIFFRKRAGYSEKNDPVFKKNLHFKLKHSGPKNAQKGPVLDPKKRIKKTALLTKS